MIPEIKAQLGGIVPDAIVCSVGGGGLINGIILGLQEAGWSNGMLSHTIVCQVQFSQSNINLLAQLHN